VDVDVDVEEVVVEVFKVVEVMVDFKRYWPPHNILTVDETIFLFKGAHHA